MVKFEITATMNNGDKWMTVRNTFKGMDSVVKDILKDKEVKKFTVEEKKSWLMTTATIYNLTKISYEKFKTKYVVENFTDTQGNPKHTRLVK